MKLIKVLPHLLISNNNVGNDCKSLFNVIILNSNYLITWVNSECNLLWKTEVSSSLIVKKSKLFKHILSYFY